MRPNLSLPAICLCVLGCVCVLQIEPPNVFAAGRNLPSSRPVLFVSPTLDLDPLIAIVESKEAVSRDKPQYAESRKKWEEYRAGGKKEWEWLKTREEYKKMNTQDLAGDFLSRGVFINTAIAYSDIQYAFVRMEVLHDGFAELIQRDDMWFGVLKAYRQSGARLKAGSDFKTAFEVGMDLESLRYWWQLSEFHKQIKGHEKETLGVVIDMLERVDDYQVNTNPPVTDEMIPFYSAPAEAVNLGLAMAHAMDPKKFDEVAGPLLDARFPGEQHIDDLRKYVHQALEVFRKFPTAELPEK